MDDVFIKEGEIDRGRTIKSTFKVGKKTIEVWDRCAESVRFRTKKDINEYRSFIEEQKKEIDQRIELWSSKIYNKNADTFKSKR